MPVDHYENFPVASWLCPPRIRPAVAAIYWYARTADDIADEGSAAPAQRLADLAAYRAEMLRVVRGDAPSARWREVFEPLARAVQEHALPQQLLDNLLSAFAQDVVKHDYADRAELLDYCRRSANPIGRLLLHLYAIDGQRWQTASDAICSGLQLINFWQDLGVDTARGRLYIPLQDCRRAGVAPDALRARVDSAAVRSLVAECCRWARELMLAGAPLVHRVPGRAGWELRLVVQGGLRVLDKSAALGFATLSARPRLGAADAPAIVWRAVRMRAGVGTPGVRMRARP